MSPAARTITPGMPCWTRKRRMRRRLFASLPVERTRGNNDAVVALALILLVLVAVLVVAIVVNNPQIYELSIFGAIISANTVGIFITGAVAMAVTILALLLLRSGIRRSRARRDRIKALEASDEAAARASSSPAETSMNPASDLDSESSTAPSEGQAMLDEADELTREDPQK
jgi:hypothetical protein